MTSGPDQGFVVYVGNLSKSVRKDQLDKEFRRFGRLKNIWVACNPPGFAFITYKDKENAHAACSALNNSTVFGTKLRVEMSRKSRGPKGGHRVICEYNARRVEPSPPKCNDYTVPKQLNVYSLRPIGDKDRDYSKREAWSSSDYKKSDYVPRNYRTSDGYRDRDSDYYYTDYKVQNYALKDSCDCDDCKDSDYDSELYSIFYGDRDHFTSFFGSQQMISLHDKYRDPVGIPTPYDMGIGVGKEEEEDRDPSPFCYWSPVASHESHSLGKEKLSTSNALIRVPIFIARLLIKTLMFRGLIGSASYQSKYRNCSLFSLVIGEFLQAYLHGSCVLVWHTHTTFLAPFNRAIFSLSCYFPTINYREADLLSGYGHISQTLALFHTEL